MEGLIDDSKRTHHAGRGSHVAVGLIVHALFPRYEWRVIGESGAVIVVHDRWSNYLQRAVYDEQGRVKPNDPFKPF